VLYNANVLSFKGAYGLLKFRSLLPNSNWNRIKRLSISTTFVVPKDLSMDLFQNQNILPPEDYNHWEDACSTIATLQGLQSLVIDMTLWNYRYYSMTDTRTIDDNHLIMILSPLRNIRAKYFEVEINVDIPDRAKTALEPFPFKLTERHRPYNTTVFRQG
jgi:hypothetical protein